MGRYQGLLNKRMEEKLNRNEAVDLANCERLEDGDYLLTEKEYRGKDSDVDYCDADQEVWIWSMGQLLQPMDVQMQDGSTRRLEAGTVLASTSGKHYSAGTSDIVECVWLR